MEWGRWQMLTVVGPRHHVVVRRRIKAHSSIHCVAIVMKMLMVVHVGWDWRLSVVQVVMMAFLTRTVGMRWVVMVRREVVFVGMLRLPVMHVGVIVVIAVGAIIDGIVVVISIVARFILGVPI